jgi:CxxC motif-containing protein
VKVKERDMKNEEIICVGCPIGCHVVIRVEEDGKIAGLVGNECKVGEKYVAEEFRAPVRVFTGTVRTRNCSRPLLPVRTNKPIPKAMISNVRRCVMAVQVEPPIRIGDVIISNVYGTGVHLIATSDLGN